MWISRPGNGNLTLLGPRAALERRKRFCSTARRWGLLGDLALLCCKGIGFEFNQSVASCKRVVFDCLTSLNSPAVLLSWKISTELQWNLGVSSSWYQLTLPQEGPQSADQGDITVFRVWPVRPAAGSLTPISAGMYLCCYQWQMHISQNISQIVSSKCWLYF